MAPNTKAATNLITNGGFEDPLATEQDAGNWEGGTRVNSESYTGSYSLYTVYAGLVRERLVGLPDGTYYFSMMYKPVITANMNIHIEFKGNTRTGAQLVVLVIIITDNITQDYGVTNASVTIMSGGWRNIAFSLTLDRTGYADFTDWHIKFQYTADGFIDDVWLSTTGAISFYSDVSLVSPADDSTASSLNANFTYTPNLNNTIVNASLWLNSYNVWQRVTNTTIVSNGTLNNFTYALPYQGVYLWNVEVWDSSNYFFAPANYTLTVQSGTIDKGHYLDSCDNTTMWNPSGSVTQAVDTSDYMEPFGSLNLSWIVPSYISYNLNFTPPHVFGFFLKFGSVAYDSNTYIFLKANDSVTNGMYLMLKNASYFYLNWQWWTAPGVSSSDILIDPSHWYWIELSLPTTQHAVVYLDGVSMIDSTTGAYAVDEIVQIQVNNPLAPASYKFDFIRIGDSEEYPVFLTPTIDVTSNPELNAFFSMATNASTLQTETLCVNGNVSENMGDLGHVGTYPWLDTQDDNTSYVQTNLATATYDQYYTFNQTTLLTVSSATLHVRLACFPISSVVGVLCQVYLWNGSSYVAIEGFQRYGDWLTMNSSTLFTKGFNTPTILNQMRLKIYMNLNQQVPGMTYLGRCSAIWLDVSGYGNPEGSAIHQTPYSFNPVSATYVLTALNTTLYSLGTEYSFSGFTYTGGSYNGSTLIFTSLSGVTSVVLEYSVVAPSGGVFLVPFMFLFWVIGLFCLFLSPIYAIDKVKKREYLVGLVGGVILGAIGFGLFIGGLWGITI